MAYYLSRYIGKYRVKSEIDLDTNDFPRDSRGQIEDCNTYIKCSNNAKIFHYGRSILECYVPSTGRGRNMLKAIGAELGLNIESYGKPFNYRSFYKDLENKEVVFDIYESDEEVGWKFHAKHMDLIAKYMSPQTSGASISPFSPKNLPKKKYEIAKAQIEEYKRILSDSNLDDKLVVGRITTEFITQIIPKKHRQYSKVDMKALMRKEMLKGKEFIHFLGYWDEYLAFLEQRLLKERWNETSN